jgi:ABC-2 type transport system ATP-binding protein
VEAGRFATPPAVAPPSDPAAAAGLAIRCRGLHKRFGATVAVRSLDLDVRRGECFGLLGPNGAGKTTTIEILEGLQSPDAGEVEILGLTWARDAERIRRRLGIQLQETALPDKLEVREAVQLFRSFYPAGRTVRELLDVVELGEKRSTQIRHLSGGQKQRLSLACALAGSPEILFLDEPTTGLDPQSRRQLWDLVEEFRAAGGTILLTTHFMDEAEKLSDRIAILDRGEILVQGTPRELIASLGGAHVVEFSTSGSLPADALGALPEVTDVAVHEGVQRLTTRHPHRTVPALLALTEARGVELTALKTHHATLDDVFLAKTGRQLRDE